METKKNNPAVKQTAFEIAINKGLDVDVVAEHLGVMYLLASKMEEVNAELCEYMKQYGLLNNYRNDVHVLNKNFKSLRAGIIQLIDEEGKANLFKEYDKLSNMINKYIAEENTCTTKK